MNSEENRMEKNFLRFRQCSKKAKGTRGSNIIKKIATVLLFVTILSSLVIPMETVNASTITYGDLNGNWTVDSVDLAIMKKFLLGTTDTINKTAADVNGDTSIDSIDFSLMKQFLLGNIIEFPVRYKYVTTSPGSIIHVNEHEPFEISLREGGFVGLSYSYTVSDKMAIALLSKESFNFYPNTFDTPIQTVWTFTALKAGKYTLLFSDPHSETIQCEIYVSTTPGSIITANVNEPFNISLEENGTTGYSWFYTISEENATNLISLERFLFSDAEGSPTQTVWTFQALKPGKYTFSYNYCRSWEPNIDPIKTVQCELYIR